MTKLNRTIVGLGKILVYCHNQYNKCDSAGQIELSGINQTAKDAIDLLKTLRPRVLARYEIHRGMAVWLEDRDKPDLLLAIGGSSCAGAKCFIGENDKSIAANDDEYNIRWRAWTQEPTDEQRKVAKWHDA